MNAYNEDAVGGFQKTHRSTPRRPYGETNKKKRNGGDMRAS